MKFSRVMAMMRKAGGNFQMWMLMWVGISDPDIFRNVFMTGGRWNRGKYTDPEVDLYVSLWYESNIAVMRRELSGMRLTPDADRRVLKDVYWGDATK